MRSQGGTEEIKLAILILSAVALLAQTKDASPRNLPVFTVATLPSAATWSAGIVVVTDALTAGSCTAGTGTRVTDSTGSRFRTKALTGLTGGTLYYFRVYCAKMTSSTFRTQ
jgi:hypothetical protein